MGAVKQKTRAGSVLPEVVETPSRFRNPIGKYVVRRISKCISCGLCATLCPYGVHLRYENYSMPIRPRDYRCIGFKCEANDFFCVKRCPQHALSLSLNPMLETLGDHRWPAEMLMGHWYMAETGNVPFVDLEYSLGYSNGGFDKIRFRTPDPKDRVETPDQEIDTSINLNKRRDGRPERTLSMPCYGGGMSFGSTALSVMVGRARAALKLNSLTCTGEGGYPQQLVPYSENVITQIATGLFGVAEETILYAPVVEFKYAQGAKPGLGGHLLGDKVTTEVAKIRETVVGSALFSPFPFHSVYSVEDHKKHKENERLFGIKVDDLLTVDGAKKAYQDVYRKVQAVKLDVLAARTPARPSPAEYADVVPEGEDADE